jgi:hypothetical protein
MLIQDCEMSTPETHVRDKTGLDNVDEGVVEHVLVACTSGITTVYGWTGIVPVISQGDVVHEVVKPILIDSVFRTEPKMNLAAAYIAEVVMANDVVVENVGSVRGLIDRVTGRIIITLQDVAMRPSSGVVIKLVLENVVVNIVAPSTNALPSVTNHAVSKVIEARKSPPSPRAGIRVRAVYYDVIERLQAVESAADYGSGPIVASRTRNCSGGPSVDVDVL